MSTWLDAIATLFSAKGDILTSTDGDAVSALPVGANGQVLTADSAASRGVKWAAPSAGTPAASAVTFTPAGTIAATDVQAALAELDTELPARISSAISAVVAGAPGALDTLDELAAALGDDANFASTVTTALAGKIATSLVDAKGDLLVGTADNTITRKAVGTDGQVLTADAASAGGLKWATPSGGTSIKDRLWTPGSSETTVDEFNDGSQDAAMVRVDNTGSAGKVTWTESGDVMSMYHAGGDTGGENHALIRPLSGVGGAMAAGDAFVGAVRLLGPRYINYSVAGICLTDGTAYGAGKQLAGMTYVDTGGMRVNIRSWTNFNTYVNDATTLTTNQGELVYLRLVMIAANTWRLDVSPDGISWYKGANFSYTITPTQVGLWTSSFDGATKCIASFELLRRVAGIS